MSNSISGWQSALQGWMQARQTATNNRNSAGGTASGSSASDAAAPVTVAPAATPAITTPPITTPPITTAPITAPAATSPTDPLPSAVTLPATVSGGVEAVTAIAQQLAAATVSLRDLYDRAGAETASATAIFASVQAVAEASTSPAKTAATTTTTVEEVEAQRSRAAIVAQAAYGLVAQASARQDNVMGLIRRA